MDIEMELRELNHYITHCGDLSGVQIKSCIVRIVDLLNELNDYWHIHCRTLNNNKPQEELKPCQCDAMNLRIDNTLDLSIITCLDCGMNTGAHPNENAARKVWNRRSNA